MKTSLQRKLNQIQQPPLQPDFLFFKAKKKMSKVWILVLLLISNVLSNTNLQGDCPSDPNALTCLNDIVGGTTCTAKDSPIGLVVAC